VQAAATLEGVLLTDPTLLLPGATAGTSCGRGAKSR
jgi:hypothetical protein